jgi:hypothetical protein
VWSLWGRQAGKKITGNRFTQLLRKKRVDYGQEK